MAMPAIPYLAAAPLPMPSGPWQMAQLIWNCTRPRATDAESAGVGFGIVDIATMLCGIGSRLYSNPGAALPTVGTDACGLARGAIVSAGDSQGSIFGCCLKSVNQEQALSSRRRTPGPKPATRVRTRMSRVPGLGSRVPKSTLTSHLLGPVLLENVHRRVGAVRIGDDPNAEVSTAEARVITDGHR